MGEQPPPPREYPVGAIVNGHVWTGTEWVPALNVPAPPPNPVTPRRPPLSERYHALPARQRFAIGIGAIVVAVPVSLFLGWLYDIFP